MRLARGTPPPGFMEGTIAQGRAASIGARGAGPQTQAQRLWANRGPVPRFKKGGMVPGKKGKPKMVMAHGGERVLTAKQNKEYEGHKKSMKPHRGVMSVLKAMRGKK